MAYNFKSIADVEVVEAPAETANVLIEENGVVKKAPKTAVGGAGGSEADLVIAINGETDISVTPDVLSVESGSVENAINKFLAGNKPVVKVKYYQVSNDSTDFYVAQYAEFVPEIYNYGGNFFLSYVVTRSYYQLAAKVVCLCFAGGVFSSCTIKSITLS